MARRDRECVSVEAVGIATGRPAHARWGEFVYGGDGGRGGPKRVTWARHGVENEAVACVCCLSVRG